MNENKNFASERFSSHCVVFTSTAHVLDDTWEKGNKSNPKSFLPLPCLLTTTDVGLSHQDFVRTPQLSCLGAYYRN